MYTPDNLQKKIDILESYPDVGLVYADGDHIDAQGYILQTGLYGDISPSDSLYPSVYPTSAYTHSGYIDTYHYVLSPRSIFSYSSSMCRASVLQQVPIRNITTYTGIYDKNFSVSDWDFYYHICTQYRTYYLADHVLQYRIHGSNISRGTSKI
jgi:hypothetical protein